jgi:hypothetical protein
VLAGFISLMLGLASPTQDRPPAALVVRAVDAESGNPVNLSSAEIYVDVWGTGETYRLKTRGNEVDIPLGVDAPCRLDKGWCDGAFTFEGRITLRADGYEPIASDQFQWLKAGVDDTRIRFPGPVLRTIRPGTRQSLTLTFRRAGTRVLRFVNRHDRPVAGVRVTVRELLARTNHCGAPEGVTLLERTTGPSGILELPAAQTEFAVTAHKPHHVVVGARSPNGDGVDGRFESPENRIVLRPLVRRPLNLRFLKTDGSPAGEIEIFASSALCACGLCDGPLGKADAAGQFVKTDFYPEEFASVYIGGPAPPDRQWEIDPRKERWRGTKVVTLK